MVEKPTDSKDTAGKVTQEAIASAMGSAQPALSSEQSTDPNAPPFVSAGKRIHNEMTYRVIDWLVNSSIGVAFTYWTTRTASGEKYFGKPVAGFFKKVLSPILKEPEALEKGAKWGGMFASIMAGGTAIIPPMMVMENKHNKKAIVRWLDEKIYGKETVAHDPKFEESYRAIDEEPKKSFATGMAARFLALAPLIAWVSLPKLNDPAIKYLYDPIGKASKWVAESIGIRPKKMLVEGTMELVEGNPKLPKKFMSNWDFLHRTIGFDFGLTFFYAILHEAAFKALAAVGVDKNAQKNPDSKLDHIIDPEHVNVVATSAALDATQPQEQRWIDKAKTDQERSPLKPKAGSFEEKVARSTPPAEIGAVF
ncbi:MAG: hypothetical protein SFT92_01005 [Rickettsiales bacterium]|nr:hypothetical protein [Rickettsiales bacterium]